MAIIYKYVAMFLQKFACYCTQVFLIHTSTQLFVLFLRSGGIDIGLPSLFIVMWPLIVINLLIMTEAISKKNMIQWSLNCDTVVPEL